MYHFCKRKIYSRCPLIQQNISAKQVRKQSCQNKCNIVFQAHISEFAAQAVCPQPKRDAGVFIFLKNDINVPLILKLPSCPWEMLSLKKILSCFRFCANEAGGNQKRPARGLGRRGGPARCGHPQFCILGQGNTYLVLYYNCINLFLFVCLFVLIALPSGLSRQGCGKTEKYIN